MIEYVNTKELPKTNLNKDFLMRFVDDEITEEELILALIDYVRELNIMIEYSNIQLADIAKENVIKNKEINFLAYYNSKIKELNLLFFYPLFPFNNLY